MSAVFRYRIAGIGEVSAEEYEKHLKAKRRRLGCKKGEGLDPAGFGDFGDFRRERDRKTGLDGRYAGQLARYPGDPTAVFPSKKAMLEAAARRGMVEDKS